MNKKKTLREEGYTYVKYLGHGEHLLKDPSGDYEVFFANKGHGSWGLRWKNTDLEFARSASPNEIREGLK